MTSPSGRILLNSYHILIDGLFDSVPVLLAFAALAFGSGEEAVGVIVSLGGAAGTLAGLATPAFSERLGFSLSVCLVAALYSIGFLAAAFTGDMVWAGACFVLAVTGHAVYHNMAFSHLTIHTERRFLGKEMSDFTAIGDIGRIPLVSFAGFAAAYTVAGISGWRAVCFGYGAAALLAVGYLFVRSRREEKESTKEKEAQDSSAAGRTLPSLKLLHDRRVALALLASMLNAFSCDRIFTFLPLLLLAKGIDAKIIGTFALGFTVGSFLGKMACGRMVDRFGSRVVFIFAGLALTILLLTLILGQALWLIIIVALLLGIVTKGTVPVIQTIITEPLKGARAYDEVFSLNSFGRGIVSMFTPLGFGLLASARGMDLAYLLMALAAATSVVPVLLMPKADTEQLEE